MKKWYLKLDQNNVIRDAIEYPFAGYIEVELPDVQLPAGFIGGWFIWDGTTYHEDLSKKPQTPEEISATSFAEIKDNQLIIMSALADLYEATATV